MASPLFRGEVAARAPLVLDRHPARPDRGPGAHGVADRGRVGPVGS